MSEDARPDHVETLKARALEELGAIERLDEIEAWRVAYLGRRGRLTTLLRSLGSLAPDQRRRSGAAANDAKRALDEALDERKRTLMEAESSKSEQWESIDVTLPGWPLPSGGLHPTTRAIREICGAFASMGFEVAEGPEVESDHYNFEMLNIPKHHPARDMFNTLWIDYRDESGEQPMLLRTHTSPMQGRIMEKASPPIRVVVPGKVFRYEATDSTHEWHFHQVEGLAVGEGVTFADLKGTLYEFARRIFGPGSQGEVPVRLLPFRRAGSGHVGGLLCLPAATGCRLCSDTGMA